MSDIPRVKLTVGVELPDIAFTWRDGTGAIIPFETEGYTFQLRIETHPTIVKGTLGGEQVGITRSDGAPNVIVTFAIGDLDDVESGFYGGQLRGQRADGKERTPINFDVELQRVVPINASEQALTLTGTATVTATDVL